MIVYDRSVALIPDDRYERLDHGLLIEHPGVARFLAGVFDHAREAPSRSVSTHRTPGPRR
ncbi:hypothetical protein [Streptomyces purpureus]|uniref:hypothetical protein n=1 Tax=Streptomyces purpureus TaxID=1951 RepID=UPI00035D672A|nr:hypothetical protein [Streptomyces purpureus]